MIWLQKMRKELDTSGTLGGFNQNKMRYLLQVEQDKILNGIVGDTGVSRVYFE